MTLEELLHKLKNLKYTSDLIGKKTEFSVLNNENFGLVENLIREYALDNHDSEMGELKAKLYVYEQIIAKSNFAPMLKDGNKQELEWISMKDKRPLQGEEVIITCKDGLSFETYVTTGAYDHDAGVFELDDEHTISVLYVIAWMPLPTPYKENKNE